MQRTAGRSRCMVRRKAGRSRSTFPAMACWVTKTGRVPWFTSLLSTSATGRAITSTAANQIRIFLHTQLLHTHMARARRCWASAATPRTAACSRTRARWTGPRACWATSTTRGPRRATSRGARWAPTTTTTTKRPRPCAVASGGGGGAGGPCRRARMRRPCGSSTGARRRFCASTRARTAAATAARAWRGACYASGGTRTAAASAACACRPSRRALRRAKGASRNIFLQS